MCRTVISLHMRNRHTHCSIYRAMTAWTTENGMGFFLFVETDKNGSTLLLSWIYYCLLTNVDVLRPGSEGRCRRYVFCQNDKRFQCAREVRQHNMYHWRIIRISWNSFKEYALYYYFFYWLKLPFPLVFKHITIKCS